MILEQNWRSRKISFLPWWTVGISRLMGLASIDWGLSVDWWVFTQSIDDKKYNCWSFLVSLVLGYNLFQLTQTAILFWELYIRHLKHIWITLLSFEHHLSLKSSFRALFENTQISYWSNHSFLSYYSWSILTTSSVSFILYPTKHLKIIIFVCITTNNLFFISRREVFSL